MTTQLFWNNICLITKTEEEYINNKLTSAPIEIKTRYFGLGRPMTMLDYYRTANYIEGDVILSTDTDIFHDSTYDPLHEVFDPPEKFISIPLVILYNTRALGQLEPPKSFQDLLEPTYRHLVVYGGPHNSAGKSLAKSLWSAYGYDKTCLFFKEASAVSMPAAAFQKVLSGQMPIAIVPTIFALRAGLGDLQMVWPSDGAIPIHSYLSIRSEMSDEIKSYFKRDLLGKDFQSYLVDKAAILAHAPQVSPPTFNGVKNLTLMEPSWSFLKALDHQRLYELLPHL